MMVRWCGLEWRLAGKCGSECVCVCVCFSKEKRNKMKETKERAGKKRGEVGENVWWRVGLGGGTRGPQKNMLTLTSSSSSSSFFIFIFYFFYLSGTLHYCYVYGHFFFPS